MNILPAHKSHFKAFKGIYNRKSLLRQFGSMSDDTEKTTSRLVSEERIKQGKFARENLMRKKEA